MGIRSYQELEVWRLAMDGVKRVYQLTGNFPRDERFGLCSQMQRAAVSIPSDIAVVRQQRVIGERVNDSV